MTPKSNSHALSPPRARTPRDHGARPSNEQLLRGSRIAFARLGYHDATMAQIAEQAGCTKPTLYAHFRDKETLYRATLTREIDDLERRLFAAYGAAEALPLAKRIRNGMLAFFDYAAAEPDGFRLLFGDQGGGPLATARARFIADIRTRIAELSRGYAKTQGLSLGKSADILAAMIVAVAIDVAQQSILVTPVDPFAASELATTFVNAGLRHLDPSRLLAVD